MKVNDRRTRIRHLLPLLAALLLSAFLFAGVAAAIGWGVWVVDSSSGVGHDTSIDFDPSDNPHVSYYDQHNADLKYAAWGEYGGSYGWQTRVVDSAGKVGRDTSINALGDVSISYYDESNKDLKYAYLSGDAWTAVVVDSGGGSSDGETDDSSSDDNSSAEDIYDVGKDTSLEMNAAGEAYISYYNDTTYDLKFAYSVTGGGNCGAGPSAGLWQCDNVDSGGRVGKFTSLALDNNGKAHISYYDETNRHLRHAWQVGSGGNCGGGKWQCETVDSSYKVGKYSSIDIGADGYPKIAYEDENNHDLKFACKGPGGWAISFIDTAGDVGEDVSLAIGKDGRPRIAYHNDDEDSLYFAMRFETCGLPDGTWITQVVDDSYRVGEDNSLALDSEDNPCISYHDEENGNLKVACWESQPPDLSLTCPVGNGIRWQSLADYTSRTLSVDYMITNNAAAAAYDLTLIDVPTTQGVTVETPLPYGVTGELGAGQGATYTVKFHVPMGVAAFSTNTYATVRDDAGRMYYYPCRPPGV